MNIQEWVVGIFLVCAIIERLYERRFSRQALRGELNTAPSDVAFQTLHALIYILSGLEFFLWRQQSDFNWGIMGVGLALFGLSLGVRLAAICPLDKMRSLSLDIWEGRPLITSRIYAWMRYPTHSARILEVVAVPLVANAFCTLFVLLFFYVPLLRARWRHEEAG